MGRKADIRARSETCVDDVVSMTPCTAGERDAARAMLSPGAQRRVARATGTEVGAPRAAGTRGAAAHTVAHRKRGTALGRCGGARGAGATRTAFPHRPT